MGIGDTAAHFGNLFIGQPQFAHMLDIVQQRAGGGILLTFGQLFDLPQGLFKEFRHRRNIAGTVSQCILYIGLLSF